jgi:hypothetical protein
VRAFAGALAALVRRHRDAIAAVEPGNEPNHAGFMRNAGGLAVYARVLRAAHRAVKRVSPRTLVLGGALAGADAAALEELYRQGIRGAFDGISIHPYDVRFSGPRTGFGSPFATPAGPAGLAGSFLAGPEAIRTVMRRHGDGDKPLWLTEFGYQDCSSRVRPCVSSRDQARWLADAVRLAAARDGRVGAALVYLDTDYARTFGGGMGMRERDGRARPAYDAVAGVWRALRSGQERPVELRAAGDRPVGLLVFRAGLLRCLVVYAPRPGSCG